MECKKRKLTIGTVVYDDYDGLYFSIQAIRLYHKEILDDIEFLIIDNNPKSKSGEAVKAMVSSIKEPVSYIPYVKYKSTAVRTEIFEFAKTDYVLCMDCHVLFEQGSLKKLIDFFDANKDSENLLQGPLLYDDNINLASHFDLIWRSQMFGVWGTDDRAKNINGDPFEIPAMGLGVFACRKNSWLGFNKMFRGFGGEEGYIHEKYRKLGRKTLCLPFLRWMHRFGRPNGVPYDLKIEDRIRNYIIGFSEVGLDLNPIKDHFSKTLTEDRLNTIFDQTIKELEQYKT
jgi:hypothetical protein